MIARSRPTAWHKPVRAPPPTVLLPLLRRAGGLASARCSVDPAARAERFVAPEMVPKMAEEMAQVLTAFCRARGVEYTQASGYAEQLAPFAALALSPGDMYNCFYALMSKYALKNVEEDRYAQAP